MPRRSASSVSGASGAAGTAASKTPRPSPKREHLLAIAEDLFDRNGFHGTGIDRLLEDSGVARMTLYKHFSTKNALVLATLQRRDERFWATIDSTTATLVADGADPVLSLFDALGQWLEENGTHGCLILRALGEFSGHDVTVAGDAAFRKRKSGAWMAEKLEQRGLQNAQARAWDLVLLMEGAIALSPVVGGRSAAGQARHAAKTLLEAWQAIDRANPSPIEALPDDDDDAAPSETASPAL